MKHLNLNRCMRIAALALNLAILSSCSKNELLKEEAPVTMNNKTKISGVLAQRGRPVKSNGTFLTDQGELLRGLAISSDIFTTVPSQADIAKIKDLGMNAIHLYAECPSCGSPGGKVALVDSVVNATANTGLYLILTIGNGSENGSFNLDFINSFWNLYAPRYKDKPHVIYEIQNEPFAWGPPYDTNTLNMEKSAFNLIRSKAPNTPILLMSYSVPGNYTAAISEINSLGLDLSNAGVAIHGYGVTNTEFSASISALKNAGFAVVVTEPETSSGNVNISTTTIFENQGVSYTHFLSVADVLANNAMFKTPVESSVLRWKPDYGTWPLGNNKIVHMTKSNSNTFAVDGGNGGANGQQIYLYTRDVKNINQKWLEIDAGGGYFVYQKLNTNYCIDGGNGGANAQSVYCWTCDVSNQNQQWQKISSGNGNFRLQKRNAPGFSIDGGNGGANGQPLYLWSSDAFNQNQQWTFLTY
ncbi:cellulase family glycosylhydrolase [Desertivirga brevis]|uniref:cellulase family glycosylhydrolase n=1 Tax=Desertivirga brevis TaxID=2810310 RepID=UPI001A96D351|nr:cellulase family glycosylhydrolase [Pedobacter sp. SYSU D00873]